MREPACMHVQVSREDLGIFISCGNRTSFISVIFLRRQAKDTEVLQRLACVVSMAGAIGGSYVADDTLAQLSLIGGERKLQMCLSTLLC